LAETKWLEKLLPGVLKRRIYGVDSGNWQACTSALRIELCRESTLKTEREQCLAFFSHNWNLIGSIKVPDAYMLPFLAIEFYT